MYRPRVLHTELADSKRFADPHALQVGWTPPSEVPPPVTRYAVVDMTGDGFDTLLVLTHHPRT
jgi:hypothetical protein